jgi:spermidine/putrescine transport system substrate-binding protein
VSDQDLDQIIRRMAQTPLSRRGFLWGSTMSATAAFLASCAPSASPSASPRASTSAAPTTAASAGSLAPSAAASAPAVVIEKELLMYNWGDYVDPTNMKAFQAQFGVTTFKYDTFANNDEMMAKFQGGAKGQWDISAPTANYVPAMRDQGFIQKLDLAHIPNASLIDPAFKKQWWDPTDEWQLPKDWGTTGITLRTKVVKEEVKTWKQFFEVAPKYNGRIVIVDSPDDVFVAPLKALGYSLNSADPKELEEARGLLLGLAPHVLAVDSDQYDAKIRTEEAVMGLTWTGGILDLRDVPETADTVYVIPEDGTVFWMDTWVVLADAPHPNAANAFLNFIMTPEIQAKETMTNQYASCSSAAKPFIDPKILNDPALYVSDAVLAKLEGQKDNSGVKQRADIYEEFKSKIGQA